MMWKVGFVARGLVVAFVVGPALVWLVKVLGFAWVQAWSFTP